LTSRLRDEGGIGNRVTIRDVWADLKRAGFHDLARIAAHAAGSITVDAAQLPEFDGSQEIKELDGSGKTLRSDRFREDGSRSYSYRLGSEDGAKRATIFDSRGRPLAQWDE